ncbi:MAG TPA: RNA methyltransferase [Anaerolineaceae bacterium]|jgi:TrmH family RNA methyltransferase|nr:RNA methyltransferase [Anaerolineaceae bacterium]
MTQDIISSPQNHYAQEARALLNQPKARRKLQAFAAEGARLVEDGLRSGARARYLLVRAAHSARVDAVLGVSSAAIPTVLVEDKLFDSLAGTITSQGIIGVFDLPAWQLPDALDFVLILDQMRDPGNLGTILRSAEAAGAQAVFLSPGTADAFAPKVLRAGMGAHFRLPILTLEWETLAVVLAGLNVFQADMDGEISCWQADFRSPCALLIGGEAEGISPEAAELVTRSVRIPMAGRSESLNAAVSAGILLFEVLRQRSIGETN